jgi:purine-binding chemotaxis protein CheW
MRDDGQTSGRIAGEEDLHYVIFSVADGRVALDVEHVIGVEAIPPITPVPGAPLYVRGIANLRGEITVAVDLAVLRGHDVPPDYAPDCFVLATLLGHPCGLLASEVSEVQQLSNIDSPLPDTSGTQLVRGLAEVGGELVSVLDADRLAELLSQGPESLPEAQGS